MKNSNICPKCGSDNIVMVEGRVGIHGTGNNLSVGGSHASDIPVPRYVCCNCGYAEEWIDIDYLPVLEAKFG